VVLGERLGVWEGILAKAVTPPLRPAAALPRSDRPAALAECEDADVAICDWTPDLPQTVGQTPHAWRAPGRDSASRRRGLK
jgi:hypothetical protein